MEIEQNFLWICWSNSAGDGSRFKHYNFGVGFLLLHIGAVDVQRRLEWRSIIVSKEPFEGIRTYLKKESRSMRTADRRKL